jgi:hypothetical protein
MPCDISFVALILALNSSARHSASSLARYLSSGLAGRALLLLMFLDVPQPTVWDLLYLTTTFFCNLKDTRDISNS